MVRKGWCVVFMSGTDYESELVKSRLDDADIPAVLLSQRDHAWNLTQGYLAKVRVLVPDAYREAAEELLREPPLTPEELEAQALSTPKPKDPPKTRWSL